MRFQTISFIAIGAIGIGAIGIYKSQAINELMKAQEQGVTEEVIEDKTVSLLKIKNELHPGDFVSETDVQSVQLNVDVEDNSYDNGYFTKLDDLQTGSYITKDFLKEEDYLREDSIKRIGFFKNGYVETREIVLKVNTDLITDIEPGLYDIYWYFTTNNGNEEIRKLKKFAINVFIRNKDDDKKEEEIESSSDSEIIAKVRVGDIDSYLQAMQDGSFKILETESNVNDITKDTYTKLMVKQSKEIQSNDISKSYKYNISVIKG